MTKANFRFCLDMLLHHEGGLVDHPEDPGGVTNMGVTLGALHEWRRKPVTPEDVRNLTRDEAAQIYLEKYWSPIWGHELPAGIDYAVFDYAVNSGVRRAVKDLQRCLGVPADGFMGPVTLAAAREADARKVITALCRRRLNLFQSLRHWATFGKGWSGRLFDVYGAAQEMTE